MLKGLFKLVLGFSILCSIQYLCNIVVKYTNIVLPAPILGIVVFACLLHFNIIKKNWVKDICELTLKYMPLLFVPLAVGIITYYSLIEKNLVAIVVNVILVATITLVITALFVENFLKYLRYRRIRQKQNE